MKKNTEKNDGENGAIRSPYKQIQYQQFVDFYVLPPHERKKLGYKNLTDWSKKNGVHRNTISRWKARDEFKSHVMAQRLDWGDDSMGEIFESWKKACLKGNITGIELWLTYFTGWDKKEAAKQPKVSSFTMDDLRTLMANLSPERDQFYRETLAKLLLESQQAREQIENGEVPVYRGSPDDL